MCMCTYSYTAFHCQQRPCSIRIHSHCLYVTIHQVEFTLLFHTTIYLVFQALYSIKSFFHTPQWAKQPIANRNADTVIHITCSSCRRWLTQPPARIWSRKRRRRHNRWLTIMKNPETRWPPSPETSSTSAHCSTKRCKKIQFSSEHIIIYINQRWIFRACSACAACLKV